MTLRLRIAATAAAAVSAVVVVIALAVYLAVRSDLRGEVDRVLTEQAQPLAIEGPTVDGTRAGGLITSKQLPGAKLVPAETPKVFQQAGQSGPRGPAGASVSGVAGLPGPVSVAITQGPPQPFTGAGGYIQFLQPDGSVAKSANEVALTSIPLTGAARTIAAGGTGRDLADVHVQGQHMRVLTLGVGPGGAVQVAQPLTEVDHELSNLVVILLGVGGGGILAAALLGGLVARSALAPIARFTRRTEDLTTTADTSHRLEVGGRDELARLARSFNRTLDELEGSVDAQRQLVADASHELRTPIASLRANVQVLEQSERLQPAERESLRQDVVDELDELTGLVADLVELARGAEPSALLDDVRLDELVVAAVARAERCAGSVSFDVWVEPTLVSGDAGRIDRAVANLLENAVKWSPPGGVVDVALRGGALAVRDRGPGFADADLPSVFARFYRSSAARGKPGSGLGLAIVKQAAESHGGRVEAANAADGGGLVTASFGAPTLVLRSSDVGLTPA